MSSVNPSSETSGSFFTKKRTKKTASVSTANDFSFTLRNIDIAKIDKTFNMTNMKNISETNSNLIFGTSSEEGTSLEKLGITSLKNEPITTIISKEKTKLQTFITMLDYMTHKQLPEKTEIPCFGCHRRFDTVPLGIPIEYHSSIYSSSNDPTKIKKMTNNELNILSEEKKENVQSLNYFDTDGVVCSFNCIYSFIETNQSPLYKNTPFLVPYMYKMIFGHFPKKRIIKSPSWRLRSEYGGPLSDEEYVNNLQTLEFIDMNQISKINKMLNPVGRVFKIIEVNK